MSQCYGYKSHMHYWRGSPLPCHKHGDPILWKLYLTATHKKRQERNNKNKTTHFHPTWLRSPDLNFNAKSPNERKIKVIKVMQIHLLVGSQTSFHGDEMAPSNWLDKSMLTSEPKTPERWENLQMPVCREADAGGRGCSGWTHAWRTHTQHHAKMRGKS